MNEKVDGNAPSSREHYRSAIERLVREENIRARRVYKRGGAAVPVDAEHAGQARRDASGLSKYMAERIALAGLLERNPIRQRC